jgi:hypothetical protein
LQVDEFGLHAVDCTQEAETAGDHTAVTHGDIGSEREWYSEGADFLGKGRAHAFLPDTTDSVQGKIELMMQRMDEGQGHTLGSAKGQIRNNLQDAGSS